MTLAASDWAYSGDSLSTATSGSGWYTGGNSQAVVARAAVPVTTGTLPAYPPPIGGWVTEPGLRYDGTSTATVEFICGSARGQGGVPCAGVTFTMTDGTHSVSHTVLSLTASTRQLSTTCTATNGSNVLTSCGSTAGFIVGARYNVPGIPGQPELNSLTSTSLTFASATTCTPTLLGAETCAATPADGEARGDGAFAGQTISDAHLTTNPATIVAPAGTCTATCTSATITLGAPASGQWAVGEWVTNATCLPVGDYIKTLGTGTGGAGTYVLNAAPSVSCTGAGNIVGSYIGANPAGGTVTTITISTSSAIGTASSGTATINQNYQGSTGTVTVTSGPPIPVYAAQFTSGDFSTLSDGPIWFNAVAYPVIGNVTLNTQAGTPWTDPNTGVAIAGCDWFYANASVAGTGTCNSSNGAWLNANDAAHAEAITANLHNLWAYKDANLSYNPAYVWVESTGTCTTSACVSTSNAEPTEGTAGNFAASVFQAVTNLKSFYNTRSLAGSQVHHNDASGGVVCVTATGSPWSGFGGQINLLTAANAPSLTLTSVTHAGGGTCPAHGAVGSDLTNVTFTHNATVLNMTIPSNIHINNSTISDTLDVIVGLDGATPTTFLATQATFEGDILKPTAGAALLFRIGEMDYFNDWIDEAGFDGEVLWPSGALPNAAARVIGSTVVVGSYTALKASWYNWTVAGNFTWGGAPKYPTSLAVSSAIPQPLSSITAYNKFLGMFQAWQSGGTPSNTANQNLLSVNNVCESFATVNPCYQISADGVLGISYNIVKEYDTAAGGRYNVQYLEGAQPIPSAATSGGSLPAGTYHVLVTYSEPTGSTACASASTECAADYPVQNVVVGGAGAGSMTVTVPPLQGRTAWIYGSTTADGNGNPQNLLQVSSGTDLANVATGATYVVKFVGNARVAPNTLVGLNYQKTQYLQRFNLSMNYNMKSDYYAFGVASGARIGNWDGRFGVGGIANGAVTGSVIGACNTSGSLFGGDTCGLGDYFGGYQSWQGQGASAVLTGVTYTSDRSIGNSVFTTPSFPALNLGEGDYCPTAFTSGTLRVPSGTAAWPWDVDGVARKNDGTGFVGAHETGCK